MLWKKGIEKMSYNNQRKNGKLPSCFRSNGNNKRLTEKAGFGIITGGGPGIMEAANRGAQEGNNFSIGCNIELPLEQKSNSFLDISLDFRYFFVALVQWMSSSRR